VIRRLTVAAILVGLLAIWWASGLGRPRADPRDFFTGEQIARADEYQTPRQLAYLGTSVLGLIVVGILAFTPLGDRLLRSFRGLPWALGAVGAVVVVVVAVELVQLPLSFWRGYAHERTWGFATQSAGAWFGDWAKALGIQLLFLSVLFLAFSALARLLPRGWPVAMGAAAAGLVIVFSFLYPVLVEPVFNRFEPLADRSFAAELQSLAERAGVPVREVLVADASRRTTKENAYVSGFGSTKRLVVYDTLLERAERDEVKLVVAHELGHRKLRHVELFALVGALGAAGTVALIWLLLRWEPVLRSTRAAGVTDIRLLPFLVFSVVALGVVTQPMTNWLSRRFEEGADRFSLQLTGDEATYIETERRLALRNLSDLAPDPVTYRFLFTHPAPAERISFAFDGPERR
jgi:STE24 endopeptidase